MGADLSTAAMISVKRSKIGSGPHAILSGSIARSYLLCCHGDGFFVYFNCGAF